MGTVLLQDFAGEEQDERDEHHEEHEGEQWATGEGHGGIELAFAPLSRIFGKAPHDRQWMTVASDA